MTRYKFDLIKKKDELLEVMAENPPTELYMTQKQFNKYHKQTRLNSYRNIPIVIVK